jgi:hypothetical protein
MSNKLIKQPPRAPQPQGPDLLDDMTVCLKALVDHGWAERNMLVVMAAGQRVGDHADKQVMLGLLRATAGAPMGEA